MKEYKVGITVHIPLSWAKLIEELAEQNKVSKAEFTRNLIIKSLSDKKNQQ